MKILKNQRGFSFIELILAITIFAIAIPSLFHLFAQTTIDATKLDAEPRAQAYSKQLMERVKSRKFDELTQKSNGNWSTTLGRDTGESATDSTTYDDVDDFNGWSQNFGNGYTGTVSVSYVSSTNLNSALTLPSPVPSNWTPSYKRILVSVSHASLPAPVQVVTVVSESQSL